MRYVFFIYFIVLLGEPGFKPGLSAQSLSRSFEFEYTQPCSKLRNPTQRSGDCRVRGRRTSTLSMYANGEFVVKKVDQTDAERTVSSIEGAYRKTGTEVLFTVERFSDTSGRIHFRNQVIRVSYVAQQGGFYFRGGGSLLWGRGATEQQGLFN